MTVAATETTATVDERKRVRIPEAKPGQVVSVKPNADGGWTITPVQAGVPLKFPPGSLLKYMTPERDEAEAEAFKAFVQSPE